jgi:hypothetical protein
MYALITTELSNFLKAVIAEEVMLTLVVSANIATKE